MDFEKVLSDGCAAVQGLMSLAIKLIKEDKVHNCSFVDSRCSNKTIIMPSVIMRKRFPRFSRTLVLSNSVTDEFWGLLRVTLELVPDNWFSLSPAGAEF